MERCPCCKARLSEVVQCPRCQTDLSLTIRAGQIARALLGNAIQDWNEGKFESSLKALQQSLYLKKEPLALVLRNFFIQQQCQCLLDMLAQKQLLPAKQRLYNLRQLLPHSPQLQKLQGLTDYLLVLS